MKIDPDAPAFPVSGVNFTELTGITKREYFAAMAMQGFCAASAGYFNRVALASRAVSAADALISELNKAEESPP